MCSCSRANHTFALDNGTEVKTCPPAMGYGFAGGTTCVSYFYGPMSDFNSDFHLTATVPGLSISFRAITLQILSKSLSLCVSISVRLWAIPEIPSGRSLRVRRCFVILVFNSKRPRPGAVNPYPTKEQIACQSPKPILLNTVRCDTITMNIVLNFYAGLRSYSI